MNGQPLLSVVIALHRPEEHLATCLWSILRQPVGAMEVVVVIDEAAAGASGVVARQFARSDSRVRVITQSAGRGPGAARQVGLAAAGGTYVAFPEASGLVAAEGYSRMVGSLERSGSDFATAPAEEFGGEGRGRIPSAGGHEFSTPAARVAVADRPGLVIDQEIWTKVFRRSFLLAGDQRWGDDGRAFMVRAYCRAHLVDVLTEAVYFHRRQPGDDAAGAAGLSEWLEQVAAATSTLESAGSVEARTRYAEHALGAELPAYLESLSAAGPEFVARCATVIHGLIGDAGTGSLARLPGKARWQLALVALGQPQLLRFLEAPDRTATEVDLSGLDLPLPAALQAFLGLGSESPEAAFGARFLGSAGTRPLQPVDESAAGSPEISVIIPVHNVAEYVDELLCSVREVVGVDLEIIVVDDHSTDATWEIVQRHAAADPRLRAVKSPGRGGGQARNHGVELARGEYLAFADGDDIVPPEAYAVMLAAARRTDAEVVTGSYVKFGREWAWDGSEMFGYDVELAGVSLAEHPSLAAHRVCWNRLIRRDFWLAEALPFPGVPRANDIVPITSVLTAARRISVVPILAYRYRTRPGAASMTAAQGSADATVSYLTEEATAALLIEQTGIPQLRDEYWSMILRHDGWTHLRHYLNGPAAQEADAGDAVVRALGSLHRLAPASAFQDLPPGLEAVYALVRDGRTAQAAALARTLDKTGRLARPAAIDLPTVHEVLAAVGETRAVAAEALSRLTWRLLVRRLIRDRDTIAAEEAEAAIAVVRNLVAEHGLFVAALPGSWEERVDRALRHGSGADLLNVLQRPGGTAAATLRSRFRTRLEGPIDPEIRRYLWVVAVREIDGREVRVPLGHIEAEPNRQHWRAELQPTLLPEIGRWKLLLQAEDEWGLCTRSIVVSASPDPASRLGRVVPPAAGQVGVTVRPALIERVRAMAARGFARR